MPKQHTLARHQMVGAQAITQRSGAARQQRRPPDAPHHQDSGDRPSKSGQPRGFGQNIGRTHHLKHHSQRRKNDYQRDKKPYDLYQPNLGIRRMRAHPLALGRSHRALTLVRERSILSM